MGKNYDDFYFILSEVARIRTEIKEFRMKNPGIPLSNNVDWEYMLKSRSGGMVIMGPEAHKRFIEITKRALRGNYSHFQGKVNEETFYKAIVAQFESDILADQRDLTDSSADKIVSKAAKYVQKNEITSATYFFPCTMPSDNQTLQFNIGPIKFINTEKFFEDEKENFDKYPADMQKIHLTRLAIQSIQHTSDAPDYAETHRRDAIKLKEFYLQHPWIIEIEIKDFERKRSKEVAELGIHLAMNIIRLFFPYSHTDWIQSYNRPKRELETYFLKKDFDGQLNIEWAKTFKALNEPGWVKNVLKGNNESWTQLAGSLIPYLISYKPVPLLYQRYINALWWYNEALSDTPPYIKITSLVNALEAVLGTDDKLISEQISTRASYLISDNLSTQQHWKAKVKSLYDNRSGLVHGTTPAFSPQISNQIGLGMKIVSETLIAMLPWMHYLAHKKQCLNSLTELHKEFEVSLPSFWITKDDAPTT